MDIRQRPYFGFLIPVDNISLKCIEVFNLWGFLKRKHMLTQMKTKIL